MKLDVQQVLRGAEAIYLQLTRCQVGPGCVGSGPSAAIAWRAADLCSPLQDLPLKVQQVLGLYSPSSPEGSPDSQTVHVLDQTQAGSSDPQTSAELK